VKSKKGASAMSDLARCHLEWFDPAAQGSSAAIVLRSSCCGRGGAYQSALAPHPGFAHVVRLMASLGLLLGTSFEPRNLGLMFGFIVLPITFSVEYYQWTLGTVKAGPDHSRSRGPRQSLIYTMPGCAPPSPTRRI